MELGLAFSFSLFLFFLLLDPSHGGRLNKIVKNKSGSVLSPAGIDPSRVTQLSWTPRAFLYKGFLSEYECDHLMNLGKVNLQKSMVVDSVTGRSVPSAIRTSSGMFLFMAQDEVVARIEQRISAWTLLPIENGEELHVIRYEVGEKYETHPDYFVDQLHLLSGDNRVATVLMYLSNVEEGGETVFPHAKGVNQTKDNSWSECAKQGFAVKPSKGDALLFFSLHPNATVDISSWHRSCPVIKGVKWAATKWIHVKSARRQVIKVKECVDEHPSCSNWAMAGECQKNPTYMIGNNDFPGACRISCKVC